MKKMRVLIMTLAILLSIGGAFATRPNYDCVNNTQYHMVAGGYVSSGVFGVNFGCLQSSNVCSYWFDPNTQQYEACRQGTYAFIQFTDKESKK